MSQVVEATTQLDVDHQAPLDQRKMPAPLPPDVHQALEDIIASSGPRVWIDLGRKLGASGGKKEVAVFAADNHHLLDDKWIVRAWVLAEGRKARAAKIDASGGVNDHVDIPPASINSVYSSASSVAAADVHSLVGQPLEQWEMVVNRVSAAKKVFSRSEIEELSDDWYLSDLEVVQSDGPEERDDGTITHGAVDDDSSTAFDHTSDNGSGTDLPTVVPPTLQETMQTIWRALMAYFVGLLM